MVEKAGFVDFKINPNQYTIDEVNGVKEKYQEKFSNFSETLKNIWSLIGFCDKYIEEEKPWALTDENKKREIFSNLLYALKNIGEMIDPFLPETALKMKNGLGEKDGVFNVKKDDPLFPTI
jgi:methionyl-tRNA synthetase